jgi:hypothetical protein
MFDLTAVRAASEVVEQNNVTALWSSQAGEKRACKSMCSTTFVMGTCLEVCFVRPAFFPKARLYIIVL